MKRNIITINEDLCNGCGLCVEGCHEHALQIIDGKARIVNELYCDGLGACLGDCPLNAIKIETREAEPYDEYAVMKRISNKGEQTILAHLRHLKEHGEMEYLYQGIEYVKEHNLNIDLCAIDAQNHKMECGCPGSMARSFVESNNSDPVISNQKCKSELSHWPVQLHLLNPEANYFIGADVVLAADCTAYAYAGFHNDFLKGKKLAIACPKLDSNKESYVEKIIGMIDSAKINTLTVVIMEVPCCGGLIQIALSALEKVSRKIPVKKIIIGVQGELISETWI